MKIAEPEVEIPSHIAELRDKAIRGDKGAITSLFMTFVNGTSEQCEAACAVLIEILKYKKRAIATTKVV
ncbi:MAG: hypothetical protein WCT46_04520 [Candidatus Gracilibacteria bacterium]|jgi:hypothetical protein